MPALATSHAAPRRAALDRIAAGAATLLSPFRRRKVAAELSELDDRLLKDIGLTRFDVDSLRRLF